MQRLGRILKLLFSPSGSHCQAKMLESDFVDYFELLGVPVIATTNDISQAYRKMALECHPDRHGGHGKICMS
jgi:hypothetical protein